jgi:hypothetical protein
MEFFDETENSNLFFHPSLSRAWIETYYQVRDLEPAFCIATSNDLKILYPLVIWKQNWKNAFRKLLVPVGYSDFDYHDPLFRGSISNEWGIFYKELLLFLKANISFDTLLISGIHTKTNGNYWSEESEIAPYCNIGTFSSTEQFLQSRSASLRGDIRRQIKRIEAKGRLVLEHLNSIEGALTVLPQFLNYHTERWPGSYKAPHFHENLLKYGLDSGIVDLSVLKCGDEIISWHLGFISKASYLYYMPAIKPEFENFSPGKIHLYKLTEFALDKGLVIFDHLRGQESYKAGWTNDFSKLYKYRFVSSNPVSLTREFLCTLKNHLF